MIITSLLLYGSYLVLFVFSTICLAAGLYYIAELVEEYTMFTKKVIRYTIFIIAGIHVLLLFFENFPIWYVLLGLVAHGIYYSLLNEFPFIELTNWKFVLSVVFIIVDHCAWFYYFSQHFMEFQEVVAFFIICVWLVPFAYFISLSANESTLPYGIVSSSGEVTAEDFTYGYGSRKRGKRTSSFMVLLNWLKKKKDSIFPNSTTNQKLF